ncbi:homogentisate 1,2-dioxygenase [Acuticoccus sp. I52.16.1]|uniref:homogentisate 1,2-dioxygenase n=1 Tax=Acuticoccus sp. I52.16.1 TaxID=2928472 RepID=UPI001FCF9FEB|nr:homogentisate 1,2-dioxygenase [Acuticoccus sp. I52.16.1]UOM36984.1 homogentisate 1,2-dioxygenase [Acuticoccus sp. I52.16.1]
MERIATDPATRPRVTTHEGYMPGFGNDFETEALYGALPVGRNSPQRCPYGLYAEQLSGSPFTAPRVANERSWLYRMRPTVRHFGAMVPVELPLWRSAPVRGEAKTPPIPLRWGAAPIPDVPLTFLTGMRTVCAAGDASGHQGTATHVYHVTRSMEDAYFYNADGEMLVVPQVGALTFFTEMGIIDVAPGEIAILPRGCKFKVLLGDEPARGYVLENYGAKFTCPDRGPIGANCLANPRDFLTPVAAYEEKDGTRCTLTVKWGGDFHAGEIDHSPLDVVAWHGNYAPYKYNLRNFSPVGPILFDHADPSIFTVLTSPSGAAGTANVDFVIFPPRWLVAENTFRPPWYHMNIMSEFMGLIEGVYDAKPEGFVPGGMSLHNCMLPHGPDTEAFMKGSFAPMQPAKLDNTIAFMFETLLPQHLTRYAAELPSLQTGYRDCWAGLAKNFDPARPEWNG